MAIFSVAALAGSGLGPLTAGWIEMNSKLQWRWIQWIQMMWVVLVSPLHSFNVFRICGVYSLAVPLFLRETRSSILLTRLAKKLRKETGDPQYRARIEDQRASLTSLIFISCTRPIRMHASWVWSDKTDLFLDLLFTEPVVSAFSVIFLISHHSCASEVTAVMDWLSMGRDVFYDRVIVMKFLFLFPR